MTIDSSREVSDPDRRGARRIAPAKLALAEALRTALQTAPLAKVTVSGLAEAAGVHRQTFYAHFRDVYDLASWVFATDISDRVLREAGHETWADGLIFLLRYLRANRNVATSVIDSLSHRDLERFLFHALRRMMRAVADDVQGDLRLRPEDRAFIVDHYTLAVLGHVEHWVMAGMKDDPAQLVTRVQFIMEGQVRESFERAARRARTERG